MPKKQIVGVVFILIILSFICMFIYDEFKDVKGERETKLVVETGDNKLTLYYTDSSHNYYLYGLDKITVDYGDRTLDLNKALEAKQITIDEVIEIIGDKNPDSYWDDGSNKFHNSDISLLQCSTTMGNHDYYFGPSNMEYKSGFCKEEAYVCSFVRTYLVLDISNSNDENYKYLTLRSFQGEEVVSVKVDSSLIETVVEDRYYEFQFHSMGNHYDDTIESIFDNFELVSVTATDKVGLEQIQDNICG